MKCKVSSYMNGLHWLFINTKKETLSVILHDGSYGHEAGLFEIQPSWRKPVKWDSVKGHLTFGQVQKWINELEKREKEDC